MPFKRSLWLAAVLSSAFAAPVAAQLNSSRNITLVVPIAAGGGVDAVGRLVAEKLQERLKINVVVENRTGAGGTVGTDAVAKAAPDGHTLLLMESSATISKWLNKGVPFDVITDFAPIARVATSPLMLFAHPSVAAKDAKDVIALAKTSQLTVAIPGIGTPHHLANVLFNSAAKVDLTVVPYRGTGPGLADLLAGRVPLMWATPVALIPHVESRKVNALAVASLKRAPSLPMAATIAESALPGFEVEIWFGVAAPAKTPPAIVAQLAKEIEAVMALPDVKERTAKFGLDIAYAGSEQFRKIIAEDHARYGKAVQSSGIEVK
jgi:tripartite-type tricarboxylate transporter receptor subunit TctC